MIRQWGQHVSGPALVLGSFTQSGGAWSLTGNADSQLSTTTGAIDIDAAGALSLNSSAAAINVGNDAVSQAVNIATAGVRPVTVGSVTGASALTVRSGSGAMTCTAGGPFDVNAVGAVTIDSSGSTIGIGTDAVAQAINVGTGAAARTVTVGNATGATSVVINAGTGNISIGTGAQARTTNIATGAAAQAVTLGSTDSTSALTLQCGTGALTCTAGGIVDVNAAGAVTIDSSGGAISIGADDVDQPVNIGSAGERTITIGNATGATGLALLAGTAGILLAMLALAPETLAQLTGNVDNYEITASFARVSSDAGRNVSGILAPSVSKFLILRNVGSFSITLQHENTNSAEANRFSLVGAANKTLTAGSSIVLMYDLTSARWFQLSGVN